MGGGPAGLTAATYLGRFMRKVILSDAGESRLKRVPRSRNVPGFPGGVGGEELLGRMQEQALQYGLVRRRGRVESLERVDQHFALRIGDDVLEAETVLIATGVHLTEPAIDNLEEALASGRLRYCPICDGYEAAEQRLAVLGGRAGAFAEALFLKTYSADVTYVWQSEGRPTEQERDAAERAGITIIEAIGLPRIGADVEFSVDGAVVCFDVLYPSLGSSPRSELANSCGATVTSDGGILVDAHQETDVRGLFAAGDVLQGLDQIASACGQGAIAAVAIHNRLDGR